jgi:hypothetical protein
MQRHEFEMSQIVRAHQADLVQSTRRLRVRAAPGRRPVSQRVRRAIGTRFVAIGTALVG